MRKILYIDGRNTIGKMAAVFKLENRPVPLWYKYDFKVLFLKVLKEFGVDEMVFYFSKIKEHPETMEKSQSLIQAQRLLKTSLEKQGFKVVLAGTVRGNWVEDFKGHETLIFKEKGVDVSIAVDMTAAACDRHIKTAILCSSDSDLQPAIKKVSERRIESVYLGFELQPNKGLAASAKKTILIKNSDVLGHSNPALKRVLILGAKGMLGGALQKQFPNCIAWDREDCDVIDFENCKLKIENLLPSAVINCVAYNDVDGAESHRDLAFLLNDEVPGRLAKICHQLNIPLIHFTSQLVFDGVKGEYAETDAPHPISAYGESKYLGEQNIKKQTDKFYIIRTSVLFGPKGESELSKTSFVDLMLDLSLKHDTIKAVEDEESSITFINDLAAKVKEILENQSAFGIYHITNSGSATWYGLAKEIFSISGKKVEVVPVPASEFPRAARRPAKAVLLNTKLPPLRPWQEALKEFLNNK